MMIRYLDKIMMMSGVFLVIVVIQGLVYVIISQCLYRIPQSSIISFVPTFISQYDGKEQFWMFCS